MKNYIIPIFIPHYGCTHECVFCNQRKITGISTPVKPNDIAHILTEHLSGINQPRFIEAAFYGGSFTALPLKMQAEFLQPAQRLLKTGEIQAIRLSTRPDCITPEILTQLAAYGVTTIELGAQSFSHKVLQQSQRGHTAEDIRQAAGLITQAGFKLGLQLMLGLPGENWQDIIESMQQVISIKPDFVRIYPTLVLKDTLLAEQYQSGNYRPLNLAAAINYSAVLKAAFIASDIKVIRTGLQATEALSDPAVVLAGPYHPAFGEMVDSQIFYLHICRVLDEVLTKQDKKVIFHHHPKAASKLRGNHSSNIKGWQQHYQLTEILCRPDGDLLSAVSIEVAGRSYFVSIKQLFEC